MMDISKVKEFLPNCKLGEIRPCTAPGKVQFHLLVSGKKNFDAKVLDVLKLEKLLLDDKSFSEVKSSEELGVVKAKHGDIEISALTSGRVVVKKCLDEKHARELLETLAPMLKKALFNPQKEKTPK